MLQARQQSRPVGLINLTETVVVEPPAEYSVVYAAVWSVRPCCLHRGGTPNHERLAYFEPVVPSPVGRQVTERFSPTFDYPCVGWVELVPPNRIRSSVGVLGPVIVTHTAAHYCP